MKVENYQFPRSSFLSAEKDFAIIVQKMLGNKRLQKLLYYADKNCEKGPDLTQEQVLGLINTQIRLVPKIYIDKDILTYIIISYDQFVPSGNPQFRDNMLVFSIVCHFDQWNLGNFKLRPYKIAGEIDSMFNNNHLTGIGTLQFFGANQIVLNDEFAGIQLMYTATHGSDDKIE